MTDRERAVVLRMANELREAHTKASDYLRGLGSAIEQLQRQLGGMSVRDSEMERESQILQREHKQLHAVK